MDVQRRLTDPRWFPVDYDAANGALHLLDIDESDVRQASFLDNRFAIPWADAVHVSIAEVAASAPKRQPAAWLWHTSFCGSTLLARVLDVPPWTTGLKEPLILRRLSDAADGGTDIRRALTPAVTLLSRPWHPGGTPLVKPTHAALNIGTMVMAAALGDRGILLTSGLEDFLISNLKKPIETQAKAATLAERALRCGNFLSRLPPEALSPPDNACAAALQWASQRELVLDVRLASPQTLRQVDSSALFEDLAQTAAGCAAWLGLAIPEARVAERCAEVAGMHAKAPHRSYSGALRAAEKRMVATQLADVLGRALAWAERHVLPAMRTAAVSDRP